MKPESATTLKTSFDLCPLTCNYVYKRYMYFRKKIKPSFEAFDVEGSFIPSLTIFIYIKRINKRFLICYLLTYIAYKTHIAFLTLYLMYNEFIKNLYYTNKINFYYNKSNKVKNIAWETGKDRQIHKNYLYISNCTLFVLRILDYLQYQYEIN